MSRDRRSDRAADLREHAAEQDALTDALEELRAEVLSTPIEETRLSGLYTEAATSDPNIWNTVTAFVDVEDGEAAVTDESKLAEGKWAPEIVEGCDAMITVDVQRGLTPEAFESLVAETLTDLIEAARERAAQARTELENLDQADSDT